MDERKRDSMIAYLRRRMEEFGIKPEDLASALASEQAGQSAGQNAGRYRSATGDTWDGQGEMPQWLKQAISAGQTIDHFELSTTPAATPPAKKRVDWQNDPFAGSPLARQSPRS
ncbi:H-NS family nucleoid-associated regulatory protein [Paraburkholderia lacunae]|uniref:Histone family protein nucleoid-structuring protein H-NS n=1 Tax=Paraburkholderia lacunae TaxID=2211104 RepID=A0A370ND08_9BURK|nr:H-NS family nucleoid-associated regulatory protein [Paraburkholderia lacunae]RDK03492.1 histone family protein nucleoid-structuring protein H-NS [Paraburkholderia lacunae]